MRGVAEMGKAEMGKFGVEMYKVVDSEVPPAFQEKPQTTGAGVLAGGSSPSSWALFLMGKFLFPLGYFPSGCFPSGYVPSGFLGRGLLGEKIMPYKVRGGDV